MEQSLRFRVLEKVVQLGNQGLNPTVEIEYSDGTCFEGWVSNAGGNSGGVLLTRMVDGEKHWIDWQKAEKVTLKVGNNPVGCYSP